MRATGTDSKSKQFFRARLIFTLPLYTMIRMSRARLSVHSFVYVGREMIWE